MKLTQHIFAHATGPVEYLVVGEGEPVLCIHGTGVTNKVVVEIERRLLGEGFQLIVPHRPGYFGTPLGSRKTPQDAAELYACLLDHLGHQTIKVVGTSGGGPSSICFAQKYPARVSRMVLQCPVTHHWNAPRWMPAPDRWSFSYIKHPLVRKMMFPLYRHLAKKNGATRERWLPRIAGERLDEAKADAPTLELAKILMGASLDALQHPAGMQNDIDIFCREAWAEPEPIRSPILFLHDSADTFVPFEHSAWLHQQLPDSVLHELHCAGHLLWSGPDAQKFGDLRRDFLQEKSSNPSDV